MDRVFSTRMDEQVIGMLDTLAAQRGASKKSLLEEAIRKLTDDFVSSSDVFAQTSGAWSKRRQSPDQTLRAARAAFAKSMLRHQRP